MKIIAIIQQSIWTLLACNVVKGKEGYEEKDIKAQKL